MQRYNQLSHEATDFGSRSFLDSSVPMMNESMNNCKMIYDHYSGKKSRYHPTQCPCVLLLMQQLETGNPVYAHKASGYPYPETTIMQIRKKPLAQLEILEICCIQFSLLRSRLSGCHATFPRKERLLTLKLHSFPIGLEVY